MKRFVQQLTSLSLDRAFSQNTIRRCPRKTALITVVWRTGSSRAGCTRLVARAIANEKCSDVVIGEFRGGRWKSYQSGTAKSRSNFCKHAVLEYIGYPLRFTGCIPKQRNLITAGVYKSSNNRCAICSNRFQYARRGLI